MLLEPSRTGEAELLLTDPTALPQIVEEATDLGEATPVSIVDPDALLEESVELRRDPLQALDESEAALPEETPSPMESAQPVTVCRVATTCTAKERGERLQQLLPEFQLLDTMQAEQLHKLLVSLHEAFSLDQGERGETDLLQFHIDTGEAQPKKLPARRMPLVVRQEVARQLKEMQQAGVIQPSSSPWSSPVVMVRKKDGSH